MALDVHSTIISMNFAVVLAARRAAAHHVSCVVSGRAVPELAATAYLVSTFTKL